MAAGSLSIRAEHLRWHVRRAEAAVKSADGLAETAMAELALPLSRVSHSRETMPAGEGPPVAQSGLQSQCGAAL
jgi:hypothetical protein